jgi:hypothetical protein
VKTRDTEREFGQRRFSAKCWQRAKECPQAVLEHVVDLAGRSQNSVQHTPESWLEDRDDDALGPAITVPEPFDVLGQQVISVS